MPNRLARETSPYLQQHAENPVDWFPWGEEALEKARREDKPILLSIGYSACHWCHVMAHECFEDAEVAAAMNRDFVSVKVDREERPDIDQIYQTAHAILTERSGGWPLTVFLTPDQKPFFAGTYFPKAARYNLPGFLDLLPHIARIYRTQREAIDQQNTSLLASLARTVPSSPVSKALLFDAAPIDAAVHDHVAVFDPENGGLGDAPKFPHPAELALCLRRGVEKGDADAVRVATFTLAKMAEGGIYDHLGGGFCRYSVDRHWTIPHFEKMLYDNGQLLKLLVDAWLVTGNPLFAHVAEETAGWVMREMQSPEGAYYSTLDADSEHEEGKFYVWTPDEVKSLLTPDEFAVLAPHYGLDGLPNFERKRWHLRVSTSLERISEHTQVSLPECGRLLASARAKLFVARAGRIRPGRDEKILTSWNGLMIEGMARAAHVFGRDDWLASARAALAFIRDRMWQGDRLLATYKGGHAHLNAYLDDYAFLLAAMLELLQATWHSEDLGFACDLADALLDRFQDDQTGGFAFTSRDHEALILRPKPGYDNATPSGNGVAASALQRLGHVVGDSRYLEAAERTLRLFLRAMENQPNAFSTLMAALDEKLAPPRIVILRGDESELAHWQRALARKYRPDAMTFAIPAETTGLHEALARPLPAHGVNAWVCAGVSCLPAFDALDELEVVLDADRNSTRGNRT